MSTVKTVLLTGASGFVGQHLLPFLLAAGHHVRCGTRRPNAPVRIQRSDVTWVRLELEEPSSVARAMQGCDAAFYLVHGMGGGGKDYPEREARAARMFAKQAAETGLQRVVYLGGVQPAGSPSRHLASRLETGAILRRGTVPTVELRAAMILGAGSGSWQIVRDLASRLPLMVLPRWLMHHSWPVHIEDVCRALLYALELPAERVGWYDLPGAERITHRALIQRVAEALHRHPALVDVPVLTPRLSSYWIALVTRADLGLAQELVEGLRSDLDPTGPLLWDTVQGDGPMALGEAIRRTLDEETRVRAGAGHAVA